MSMRYTRRCRSTANEHLIEEADRPLLKALDIEDQWALVFDALVVVGSAVLLFAAVAMGVLIWMLLPKN
jgi:hypothetical protein